LRRTLGASLLVIAFAGCGEEAPRPATVSGAPATTPATEASPFDFVDVAAEAGLERVTWAGRPGKDHLLDSAGTGVAFLDFDRDGTLDVFVVNGWRLDGSTIVERGRHALYRGEGGGRFRDVTDAAGVGGDGSWGAAVAVADQDGDGWPDLLVTSFGGLQLFRNRGDGTFADVAPQIGLVAPGWNTGAAFLDADRDGDLDLYVAAYIACSEADVLAAQRTLDWKGQERVAFGPFGLVGAPDHFFKLDAGGRYVDETEPAGLRDQALGFGFGARALDYDRDGDADLFVANDSDANYLYRNDGAGHFEEVGLWSGVAFDSSGASQACMGIAAGDATGDGLDDLFVSNFSEDHCTLYRAEPGGLFEDVSAAVGISGPTYLPLSWGSALADLDCDGDLDLVIVNGHIYPQVDAHPEHGMSYRQTPLLLENRGGRFVDVSAQAGPGFTTARAGRGLAVGDYDDDGDLDLLMSQLDGPPVLLRNDSRGGAWLVVACEVPPHAGPLIGTRVTVTVGGRVQSRDVASGDSYASSHDPRAHFGFGELPGGTVEEVRVSWPDGTESVLHDVPAHQILRVVKESR
jgi:hypothetical protein